MLYLDYAANTPVEERVLQAFCEMNRNYFANPNASHPLGQEIKGVMGQITEEIAQLIKVDLEEIIYTSGASESNNLAIKGVVSAYRENGKHIISTPLEHSSVSGALTYLQNHGYEIDLLDVTEDGTIDLSQLKELMRKDTVLVSVNAVDSELGVIQPLQAISDIVKEYENCFFHTDATQIVGKYPFSFDCADLITFTPHKFFGLNGCGILVRKKNVVLEPMIHGGASTTIYRSGTPVPAMAKGILEALSICLHELPDRLSYVMERKEELLDFFAGFSDVRINSTEKSVPHIINISVKGVKAAQFQSALAEKEVYVSTKSACSVPNTPSRAVYSVTKDRKNAMCSWRISLSHLTTKEELEQLKQIFTECYRELKNPE